MTTPVDPNVPVVGTDGVVPVYNPNARWAIFSIDDVYMGEEGNGKHVPKIYDYVLEPQTYTMFIVQALDPVTLIPTLKEIRPANMSYTLSETDVLFGVGPGTQADTYRVYLDKSTLPYTLAVDARLHVAGSLTNYAKIFKGSTISEEGKVISKMYDSSGNFVSENIPLELAALDSHINHSIKVIPPCYTTEDLTDGEIVTAVFYNSLNGVVSKRQLLVENTSFIRAIDSSRKYVTHISLECPFMSPTLDHVIEFPLNVPLNALNLTGVVHYSDGSTMKLPVDGTKFRMYGLDQYVSSIVGQKIELVLSYSLSANETSYAGVGVEGNYVTEPYDLVTIDPNGSYTVKLYGYPVWIDEASGYTMKWWMMNLDRTMMYDVTTYVKWSTTTGPFNPKAYGVLQRKNVSINLRDISGAFKPFVHTQVIDIVLNAPPDAYNVPWLVSHESVVTRPMYGDGLFAKIKSGSIVNLSSDIETYEEWLTRVYEATYPLMNPRTEIVTIKPTHFVIVKNNGSIDFPISDWNKDINAGVGVTAYNNLYIKFVKRTSTGDISLSMAAMMIKP